MYMCDPCHCPTVLIIFRSSCAHCFSDHVHIWSSCYYSTVLITFGSSYAHCFTDHVHVWCLCLSSTVLVIFRSSYAHCFSGYAHIWSSCYCSLFFITFMSSSAHCFLPCTYANLMWLLHCFDLIHEFLRSLFDHAQVCLDEHPCSTVWITPIHIWLLCSLFSSFPWYLLCFVPLLDTGMTLRDCGKGTCCLIC